MAAVVAAILLAALGEIPQPLKPGNIWSVRELGLTRSSSEASSSLTCPCGWPPCYAVRGFSPSPSALRLSSPAFGGGAAFLSRRCPGQACPGAPASSARAPPLWRQAPLQSSYTFAHISCRECLWFYHDRYLAAGALRVRDPGAWSQRHIRPCAALAWSLVTLFGTMALVGTRDTLRFNEAVRDSSQALVNRGVPQSDIDAGYSWNGWILYAHPENLATGLDASRDVPWVSTMRMTPYMLATSPMNDYLIEREITWDDLSWPNPDRLFVLRRESSPPTASAGN